MQKYIVLILCFFAPFSMAGAGGGATPTDTCYVDGTGDFSVYSSILEKQSQQRIQVEQNGGTNFRLFDTKSGETAEVLDNELWKDGPTRYNILITYTKSDGKFRYYRKESDASGWGSAIYEKNTSIPLMETGGDKDIKVQSFFSDPVSNAPLLCENRLPELKHNNHSMNAKYELGVAECFEGLTDGTDATCTINFEKPFTTRPLVFVMPTISSDRPDQDNPATLRVQSVNTSSATIIQKVNTKADYYSTARKVVPMKKVSYLAIEPGIADFNGHTVYADYATVRELTGQNDAVRHVYQTTVNFNQIPGFTAFRSTPVVLAEIQTRRNEGHWVTVSTDGVTTETVNFSLEVGARNLETAHNYFSEDIAFLAVEPHEGKIFIGAETMYKYVFNTLTPPAGPPWGTVKGGNCPSQSSVAVTSLNAVDGVIANLNTREKDSYADGGWLRLCNIEANKVSLMIDEDEDRDQYHETMGYLAFDHIPAPPHEYCPYFPTTAQGWSRGAKALIPNTKAPPSYYFNGWTQEYIDEYMGSSGLAIGFDELTYWYTGNLANNRHCEVAKCSTGGMKADPPPGVSAKFSSSSRLSFTSSNYRSRCRTNGSSALCQTSFDSNNKPIITIKANLGKLDITWYIADSFTVRFKPGVEIGEISINKGINDVVTLRFDTPGTYYFKALNMGSGTANTGIIRGKYKIETGEGVVWHIKDSLSFDQSRDVVTSSTGNPDDFVIYAPNASINFNGKMSGAFYGLILGKWVNFNDYNSFNVYGAITSNYLKINPSGGVIHGQSDCFDYSSQREISYRIEVKEKKEFALLCEKPQFTFTVKNSDTDEIGTDYDGEIKVTLPAGLSVDEVKKGSAGSVAGSYKPDNGELILALKSTNYGTYTVTAELDSGETDASELYVAPYAFDTTDIYAVAGQDTSFTVKVKACKDNTATTVSSYSGNTTIRLSDMALSQPSLSTEEKGIEGSLKVAGKSLSSSAVVDAALNFGSGVAATNFNYDESGVVSFSLSDESFTCPTGFDCKDVDNEEWKGLKGAVTAYVRPWTFAICDPDGKSMSGTAGSGGGYKTAGESFALRVKPIVYTTGDVCQAKVTKNFFNAHAPARAVYLRAELHTPSTGKMGGGSAFIFKDNDGEVTGAGATKVNTSNSGTADDPWYDFNGLYWDEVGSLAVSADMTNKESGVTAKYFDREIATGKRNVGRFYPAHLSLIEDNTTWEYASGHDEFAYMGQGIGHNFTVQAESVRPDKNGEALVTSNYGHADYKYRSSIDYKAIVNIPGSNGAANWQNALSRISASKLKWGASDWGSDGKMVVAVNDFTFKKNGASLDGPFTSANSDFGLVSNKVDGVDFKDVDFDAELTGTSSGKAFATQPDFRYGRMKLTDVGGNQGQEISVPLRVEYWNGTSFVTNSDDSASQLNSGHYCYKPVWSKANTTANVAFGGASSSINSVGDGEYSKLYARQNTEGKEQYKLWLRLGASHTTETGASCSSGHIAQPWLQYYWNGSTQPEEDPSMTVTFGTFRGNDRVIFRGEQGFTN